MNDGIDSFYEKYWQKRIEDFGEDLSGVAEVRAEAMIKILGDDVLRGKVLDVGCGNGTTLYVLGKRFEFTPYGVDISQSAIDIAKNHGIDTKVANVSDKLPFNDKEFDVVICSEVLEHLVFPENALKEILRVAKDDAIIILTVPNIGYYGYRIKLLAGKSPFEHGRYSSDEHLHFWTLESFRSLLMRLGMKKITIKGMYWPNLRALRYYLPSLMSDTLLVKIWKTQ